jgi:hypothetical protein
MAIVLLLIALAQLLAQLLGLVLLLAITPMPGSAVSRVDELGRRTINEMVVAAADDYNLAREA